MIVSKSNGVVEVSGSYDEILTDVIKILRCVDIKTGIDVNKVLNEYLKGGFDDFLSKISVPYFYIYKDGKIYKIR